MYKSKTKILLLKRKMHSKMNKTSTKNVKKHNDNDVERIVEICKNQYAEAKIAYQTLAVYWRKVSSAIDGQTISYAVEHRSEFE